MKLKSNKVFVSVYRSELSLETNVANHCKAIELLRRDDIPYQVVKGVYRNSIENTFLLFSDSAKGHESNLQAALSLALLFNQDSVLEVHNDDKAVLHNTKEAGKLTNDLGTFTEVNQNEALKEDSYTYEPVSNRYFVVRG